MARERTPGIVQKIVLDALGAPETIDSWEKAKTYFSDLGIAVEARRQGRTSVPLVRDAYRVRPAGGAWIGSSSGRLTTAQRAALAPWWRNEDHGQ